MTLQIKQGFDTILKSLGVSARDRLQIYSDADLEQQIKDTVTIDKFIEFLHEIFNNQGVILNQSPDFDSGSVSVDNSSYKFLFTEEYPDSSNQDIDIVTFTISRREFSKVGQGSTPFSGVGKVRPHYIGETRDIINGGMIAHFAKLHDNEIQLLCWSTSTRHARIIAETIENILFKFYPLIRSKVAIFRYEGRGTPHLSNDYGPKRLTCIPLTFFCRTSEWFCVKQKELDSMPDMDLESIKLLGNISYD